MRPKKQTNLESDPLNRPMPVADLTEKQCGANKIAAAPPSLKAWVR
jgi:hypothetical protein